MTALISSEWYKMLHSKATAVILACISVMTVFWVLSNYTDGYVFFGYQGVAQPASMSIFLHLWYPAYVGYFIATEFQNGTIRNVICIGKSRTSIYLSKLFSVSLFVLIVLFVVIFVASVGFSIAYGFGDIGFSGFFQYFAFNFFNQALYNLALAALFTLFAFISRSPILTALLGIGYVIVNFFLIPFLRNILNGELAFTTEFFPEYYISKFNYISGDPAFIFKGIVASVAWIVLLSLIGCVLFKKSDVQ